ncbi:glycosyltransferase [bacterium]|nr:glycosyltransferase [bacterium]
MARPIPKVMHLDTEKGFRGGENQVMLLLDGLRRRGIEQIVVARTGCEFGRRAREAGYSVHEVPPGPFWAPQPVRIVRQLIDDEDIGILHAHTGNAHGLALRAAGRRPPPHIVVTRRVDFAIKSNPFSRMKYTAPCIRFIAISSGVRDVLVAGGVAAKRIDIVPSGIDLSRFDGAAARREEWRSQWNASADTPAIGTVGAYVDHKDPLNLIEAAPRVLEKLPDAKIVFVGEGELRPAMEERLEALGIADRVVLTGWQEDVPGCLAALDLFCMPSKLEGLGTSLIDALAMGLPAVGCRTGGIPDVIEDGHNGVLVPPQDSEALAAAIVDLWGDEERRTRFAEAGPQTVAERFTADRMVDGTLATYENVLPTESLFGSD